MINLKSLLFLPPPINTEKANVLSLSASFNEAIQQQHDCILIKYENNNLDILASLSMPFYYNNRQLKKVSFGIKK